MRFIYRITLLILLVSCSTNSNADNFVGGFEDIPLIDGFQQITNDNFAFGNEEARYIETQLSAVQQKNFNDVRNFYTESLEQLGWIILKDAPDLLSFYRENDILEINQISKSPLKISIILKNRT